MARALAVVDTQNDFCEGGSLPAQGGAEVAFRIAELLHRWHEAEPEERDYDILVATRDYHVDPGEHFSKSPDFVDSWPPHCVVGTDGAAFHPNLGPQPFNAVFDKGMYAPAYSGFEGVEPSGLGMADWLRAHDVQELDVVGLTSDYCVRATALDAIGYGFSTRVLLDLTAAISPGGAARGIEQMREAGIVLVGTPVIR